MRTRFPPGWVTARHAVCMIGRLSWVNRAVLASQAWRPHCGHPSCVIGKAAEVSGFTVLVSVLAFGALFGLIAAFIGVPIAAAIQIVTAELTSARRARIAAADVAANEPA